MKLATMGSGPLEESVVAPSWQQHFHVMYNIQAPKQKDKWKDWESLWPLTSSTEQKESLKRVKGFPQSKGQNSKVKKMRNKVLIP
jgi:hypothetical protein